MSLDYWLLVSAGLCQWSSTESTDHHSIQPIELAIQLFHYHGQLFSKGATTNSFRCLNS